MNQNAPLMHPEFMAFVADESSSGIVRAWAERRNWPTATVQFGGADLLSDMLTQAAPPRLVLVDLDGQTSPVETCARLVELCGPNTKLIAIGSINDIGIYRQILTTGVVDYLVKPLAPEVLDEALRQSQKNPEAAGDDAARASGGSKLIVVIGTRGGVGSTTLAVNLAWLLANEQKANTALVDLDLQFGTGALALDIEPSRGVRDIMNSPSRVDSLMIASAMIAAGQKLTVLSAEESIEDLLTVDPAALQMVLQEMRENFDYVIVDMPRHTLAAQRRAVADASCVILVSDQSLTGIRDTLRLKMALKTVDPTLPLLVVTARHGKDRAAQVDQAAFEKGTQGKIDATIPEDIKAAHEAANAGKAVAALQPNAALAKAYRGVLGLLVTKKDTKKDADKGGGLFGKLLGPKS